MWLGGEALREQFAPYPTEKPCIYHCDLGGNDGLPLQLGERSFPPTIQRD